MKLTGTCPITITKPGEYDLDTNLTCGPGTDGIDIKASDVTLHLNHHTIKGSCDFRYGVNVFTQTSHVRVLGDGTISNFFVGFIAEDSADSIVKFTTFKANCPIFTYGFYISGGSHWKLEGNIVRDSGPAGSVGIFLVNIDDDHVVANDVNDSVYFYNSSNNVIVNNIADDNTSNPFGSHGILLYGPTGSNNNKIHANTTNNNSGFGIWIFAGSTGNSITGNYSFANSFLDMADYNPNCGTNKWRGNHFGTTNQPSCIQSGEDDDRQDDDRKDDDRP